ncbi:hypothetical protein [Neolewinella antarctica]|uniref:Uncharacterized protein n=1 Tax=Neolewinella antarctica TaxID=442734 RepID=A0ABX0X6Y2_9BACT|nr:hypothetical protein [Neolewinella antarctica]NJC24756.1 hypothetical protein [Neolewinella antarctica]
MANIRIEEKESSSILPWILGLLLLALLIWGALELFGDDDDIDDVVTTEEEYVPTEEVAAGIDDVDYAYRNAIVAYMDYTNDMTGEMGLDHEFSHNALTLLADATDAIADGRNVDLTDNTGRARELANEITKDPMATNHADMIREAAMNITESLGRIDTDAYEGVAGADIDMLRNEAMAINGKTLTLNQKEDVRTFFGAARNVLSKLN